MVTSTAIFCVPFHSLHCSKTKTRDGDTPASERTRWSWGHAQPLKNFFPVKESLVTAIVVWMEENSVLSYIKTIYKKASLTRPELSQRGRWHQQHRLERRRNQSDLLSTRWNSPRPAGKQDIRPGFAGIRTLAKRESYWYEEGSRKSHYSSSFHILNVRTITSKSHRIQ